MYNDKGTKEGILMVATTVCFSLYRGYCLLPIWWPDDLPSTVYCEGWIRQKNIV